MHERLVLTDAQHSALEPFEHAYEEKRKSLGAKIVSAGRELAAAVREGNRGAPEIDQALGKLNEAQAELQRATLDHFFAMKEHLDPEQAEFYETLLPPAEMPDRDIAGPEDLASMEP
jgi:Spy/CpxP family protein refolding chaperone